MKLIKQFSKDESGSVTTDYALIIGLVAVLSISGFAGAGETVGNWYESAAGNLINTVTERPS